MTFERIRNVILATAALLAVIPGISLLTGLVDFPPRFDGFLKLSVGVTGPIVLMCAFLVRANLARLSKWVSLALVGASMVGGLALAWQAYAYSHLHLIEIPREGDDGVIRTERYLRPDHLSPALNDIVNVTYGGFWDQAIISDIDGGRTLDLMETDALPVQRNIVLLTNLAQALIIFSFLLAALKVAAGLPDKKADTKGGHKA